MLDEGKVVGAWRAPCEPAPAGVGFAGPSKVVDQLLDVFEVLHEVIVDL